MTDIIFHGIPLVEGKPCVKMEQWHNVDVYNLGWNKVQLYPMKGITQLRVINVGYLDFSSEIHACQSREVLTIQTRLALTHP